MRFVAAVLLAIVAGGAAHGAAPRPATLVGAGDIASCGVETDEMTAALLDRIPGTVFTTGDNVYTDGTPDEFARCYAPTWGRHRDRTRPAPGNHDYRTAGAAGYFGYFGSRAGPAGRGWYSYAAGAWHVVVLNSNCGEIGGCGPGSAQLRWLQADLRAHRTRCTLAYWHHPLFSSGAKYPGDPTVRDLWRALYAAGADLVLNGHDHIYERFRPQTPAGVVDRVRGIRQITVGTGGMVLYGLTKPLPTSAVRGPGVWGVLRLTLWPDRYSWRFVRAFGAEFADAGSARCH